MNENPYTSILGVFDGMIPQDTPFLIGVIESRLPNIKIATSTITLDRDNVLLNSSVNVLNNADIKCSSGNITHNLKDSLNVGDEVLIVKVGKMFIVLCKVVNI